jgi:hypothetical protein
MIGILGLNRERLGGMRPGYIMCLWSDGGIEEIINPNLYLIVN